MEPMRTPVASSGHRNEGKPAGLDSHHSIGQSKGRCSKISSKTPKQENFSLKKRHAGGRSNSNEATRRCAKKSSSKENINPKKTKSKESLKGSHKHKHTNVKAHTAKGSKVLREDRGKGNKTRVKPNEESADPKQNAENLDRLNAKTGSDKKSGEDSFVDYWLQPYGKKPFDGKSTPRKEECRAVNVSTPNKQKQTADSSKREKHPAANCKTDVKQREPSVVRGKTDEKQKVELGLSRDAPKDKEPSAKDSEAEQKLHEPPAVPPVADKKKPDTDLLKDAPVTSEPGQKVSEPVVVKDPGIGAVPSETEQKEEPPENPPEEDEQRDSSPDKKETSPDAPAKVGLDQRTGTPMIQEQGQLLKDVGKPLPTTQTEQQKTPEQLIKDGGKPSPTMQAEQQKTPEQLPKDVGKPLPFMQTEQQKTPEQLSKDVGKPLPIMQTEQQKTPAIAVVPQSPPQIPPVVTQGKFVYRPVANYVKVMAVGQRTLGNEPPQAQRLEPPKVLAVPAQQQTPPQSPPVVTRGKIVYKPATRYVQVVAGSKAVTVINPPDAPIARPVEQPLQVEKNTKPS